MAHEIIKMRIWIFTFKKTNNSIIILDDYPVGFYGRHHYCLKVSYVPSS